MPATAEGTRRFADRFKTSTAAGHYTQQQGLMMSSIGLGGWHLALPFADQLVLVP